MKKNKTYKIQTSIILLFISMAIVSFVNIKIFNLITRLSFLPSLIILSIFLLTNKVKIDKENLILIFLLASFSVGTILFTNGGFGSVIIPLYSLLVIYSMKEISFTSRQMKIILFLMLIMSFYWLIISPNYYINYLSNKTDYLNSNLIGMYLLFITINIITILETVYKKNRVLILLIILINGYSILKMNSRTSLVVLLIYSLIYYLPDKVKFKNKKKVIILFGLVIFIGTMVPLLYVYMYRYNIEFNFLMTSKSFFSGRERIWNDLITKLSHNKLSWFIGLGSKVDIRVGHALNLHNDYLSMITNFGLIGYILYYRNVLNIIRSLFRKNKKNFFLNSQITFLLSVFLTGFFESVIFYRPFYFIIFLIFSIPNTVLNKEQQN